MLNGCVPIIYVIRRMEPFETTRIVAKNINICKYKLYYNNTYTCAQTLRFWRGGECRNSSDLDAKKN